MADNDTPNATPDEITYRKECEQRDRWLAEHFPNVSDDDWIKAAFADEDELAAFWGV